MEQKGYIPNNIKISTIHTFFLDKYEIRLPRDEFYNLLNQNDTITKYKVESIDKVKGLENKNCMFIVNDSMLKYLLKKNTERNKELNYLYVALTRTKCNLIMLKLINNTVN